MLVATNPRPTAINQYNVSSIKAVFLTRTRPYIYIYIYNTGGRAKCMWGCGCRSVIAYMRMSWKRYMWTGSSISSFAKKFCGISSVITSPCLRIRTLPFPILSFSTKVPLVLRSCTSMRCPSSSHPSSSSPASITELSLLFLTIWQCTPLVLPSRSLICISPKTSIVNVPTREQRSLTPRQFQKSKHKS